MKDMKNLGFWVCEGHYHQNHQINKENIKYLNLASFAYERSFCSRISARNQISRTEIEGSKCLMKIS